MKVIKIGGGCLKGVKNIELILDLVEGQGGGHVYVVSALHGVTDMLVQGLSLALDDESRISPLMGRLKNKHMLVARKLISKPEDLRRLSRDLSMALSNLERFYYGLSFTREITPRTRDMIASFGERLCVTLLVSILRGRGLRAASRWPEEIGLITDGRYGDATANLRRTAPNLQKALRPMLEQRMYLFIPGFYGVSDAGEITTFGRGGTDYSAAVVAVAIEADHLEIWKDVDGFMSADPKFVGDARLIPVLSYEEAAELAYFGAKILHPRTMEPARRRGMEIVIKNTLDPEAPGSTIKARGRRTAGAVKSVSHDTDVGLIKIHGSGVGARPGILAEITGRLSGNAINIKSVVTSQTCITLLLARDDVEAGLRLLKSLTPKPFRRLEQVENVALVCIVGEGLYQHKGIAARCFTAVADSSVNVEMISFGPSEVALYFLVRRQDLDKALKAIHGSFFNSKASD
ncbi:MAG: aspartate kinase [Proteobacteria bacterium]|nr:aspartate kinase [Pseudomonadota bacterium]